MARKSRATWLFGRLLGLWTLVLLCDVFCVIGRVSSTPDVVYIGALLSDSPEDRLDQKALLIARDYINEHTSILPSTSLGIVFNVTRDPQDVFGNIQNACTLIQHGVSLIIGPRSSTAVRGVHAIAAGLHIPQISPTATNPHLSMEEGEYPYLMKLSAPDTIQNEALVEIFKRYDWTSLAILTSNTDYGRHGMERFVSLALDQNWSAPLIKTFDISGTAGDIDVRPQLKAISRSGVRVVVLNCMADYALPILRQAAQLDMTSEGWAWIVTDGITTSASLLLDLCRESSKDRDAERCESTIPIKFQGLLGTAPSLGEGQLYNDVMDYWANHSLGGGFAGRHELRMFDSMLTIAYALDAFVRDGGAFRPPAYTRPVCSDGPVAPWSGGETMMSYLQQVQGHGTMNFLNFTSLRYPWSTNYDIVNLQERGWVQVGTWYSRGGADQLQLYRDVQFPGQSKKEPRDTAELFSNMTLEVVTIIEEPFVMKNSLDPEQRERPLIGFCIDFLDTLSEKMGFKYNIHLVRDGSYGAQNPSTLEWDGLVGEVMKKKADMAVSPIFITQERTQYVDMSRPYMDLGLSVLLPKEKESPNLFALFDPFEWKLWLAVAIATWLCGIFATLCSFFSPFGYKGRYTQRRNKNETRHLHDKAALNYHNGVWFSLSSLMRQGPSVTPVSASGRFVAGFWWFAVTIITASYTANLAAFLTVERLGTGISSIEDLADQSDIKYGTLNGTAIQDYFKHMKSETFTKMYTFMSTHNTWVNNGTEGIKKVQNSYGLPKGHPDKFALIYDSTVLDYASRNPPCVTRMLSETLRPVGYGLMFRKHSHFTPVFDDQILKLRESGDLEKLTRKWINGPCPDPDSTPDTTVGQQLTFERMAGVFGLVAGGVVLGFLCLLVEYVIAAHRDTLHDRLEGRIPRTWWQHVKRRCHDVREDIMESVLVCSCRRNAYSLTDSRRFTSARDWRHGNRQATSKRTRKRKGSSRAKHNGYHGNNGALNDSGSSSVFSLPSDIYDLCKTSGIKMNGLSGHSSLRIQNEKEETSEQQTEDRFRNELNEVDLEAEPSAQPGQGDVLY